VTKVDNITDMANKQVGTASGTAVIVNKKARFNYDIIETYEAGLVLTGTEVKSLRAGRASVGEAYVRVIRSQAWLVGATIATYENAGKNNHDPDRDRKLLLHRREINRLSGKVMEKGLTIVPLKIYFGPRGYAKILVGLARGKAVHDKRRAIKDRDMRRDVERQMRKYH